MLLTQKEHKTRQDFGWGRGINWELCQKLKFDSTNKWYIHNLGSVLENETHKLLWDIEIQMDHQISASRPDLVIDNKKKKKKKENLPNCGLFCPSHRVKLKESKKKDK